MPPARPNLPAMPARLARSARVWCRELLLVPTDMARSPAGTSMTTCDCNPTLIRRSASPWTCPHGNTWSFGVPGDPYCWTPVLPKCPMCGNSVPDYAKNMHHCPPTEVEMESDTTTDLPPADAVVEVAFRGRVAAYNDDYNGTVSVEVLADDGRSLGYYANVPREAVWIADEHAGGA